LIIKYIIINAKITVIKLAIIMDKLPMLSPYKNHKKTPVTKIKYVVSDKPSVDLLFQT